jgi:hypothetical protein
MFELEPIVALTLEFKRAQDERTLQEFEMLLYEASCNFLTKELKSEELGDDT